MSVHIPLTVLRAGTKITNLCQGIQRIPLGTIAESAMRQLLHTLGRQFAMGPQAEELLCQVALCLRGSWLFSGCAKSQLPLDSPELGDMGI